MKSHYISLAAVLLLIFAANSCSQAQKDSQLNLSADIDHDAFGDYWYQGEAELNHYKLEEIRYGEVREGSAVMIFVTEDFLTEEQVKLESAPAGRVHRTVLKLNYVEEFPTGIYEYNMMASVFSPVQVKQYPHAMKVSISSQDWCGHAFFQLNEQPDAFRLQGFSYFESEGDFTKDLSKVLLEDEIWNKIRMSPDLLPEGEIEIIPSGFYQRFSHKEWKAEEVVASKSDFNGEGFPGENLKSYKLEYQNVDRTLTIIYEREAPYRIAGWIEKRKGAEGETLTARSVRTDIVKTDYWNHNSNEDIAWRDSLGVSRKNLHIDE